MKIARIILLGSVVFFAFCAPPLVADHWSSYGPWFVRVVGWVAQRVAPSERIVAVGTTVFTPRAEARLAIACDGFYGIQIFSILFGLIYLLNWRRMAPVRFCALYFLAVSLLWIHNAARVVAAVIRGGETHYGTGEMMILALAAGLAIAALRTPSAHPLAASRADT